jgi:potassium/hydrogen antiporter
MGVIIALCLLLLLAYVFDISSSKTKIPSVILLLILGWGVRQILSFFDVAIPDLTSVLPVLGTVGLILIVLEGSLELELSKSKIPVIGRSFALALLPMLLLSLALAYVFNYLDGTPFRNGMINAIPLAIISSAIAIPSARNLLAEEKEFVTYESSLSDIFGVIIFNFIVLNDHFGSQTFGIFSLQILLMILLSFVSTVALAFLLSKIKHHVKFTPIILLIILIYSVSKEAHLPSLIFILLFGIFIGNLDKMQRFEGIKKLRPDILDNEVHKFKELTSEMTFLIRTLFFLLFGYLIETREILNTETIIWAIAITVSIFLIRALFLNLFKMPLRPLLFIAPRGLITILLFLSIPLSRSIALVNKSLIVQVIILSSLVMMYGLIRTGGGKGAVNNEDSPQT